MTRSALTLSLSCLPLGCLLLGCGSPPPPVAPVLAPGTFDGARADVDRTVKGWGAGGAFALRVRNGKAPKAIVLVTAAKDKPQRIDKLKHWVYLTAAVDDEKVSAVALVAVRELKAGTYEGASNAKTADDVGCMIALQVGDKPDLSGPSAGWSSNGDGFCKVMLREGEIPGHFDVDFTAKLVNETKDAYYTVEAGHGHIVR